jgi:hypothetical protein
MQSLNNPNLSKIKNPSNNAYEAQSKDSIISNNNYDEMMNSSLEDI